MLSAPPLLVIEFVWQSSPGLGQFFGNEVCPRMPPARKYGEPHANIAIGRVVSCPNLRPQLPEFSQAPVDILRVVVGILVNQHGRPLLHLPRRWHLVELPMATRGWQPLHGRGKKPSQVKTLDFDGATVWHDNLHRFCHGRNIT